MIVETPNAPADLIPNHVRAARALLAWSQQELAKQAGVATSTIADFERGKRKPVANNTQAIRGALEKAGIVLLPTGVVTGPSIPPIYAPERSSVPIRWVSAQDLAEWANRQDSVASLPTLLSYLVYASVRPVAKLDFSSDEGVWQAGWDGYTDTAQPHTYVPQGETGWEFTSQRNNLARKATSDYEKRTAEPGKLDPATAAFIFVTLRHWPEKDVWAEDRQSTGPWRDVRAYDADDLVHWIEQNPAVGLWLARRLNKRPDGVRELDEFWQEWSLATQPALTKDLVLSDRDEDAATVLRWLRGQPSVLSVQATTTDEGVAFFHATISLLPDEIAAHYRARCLVATNATAVRELMHAQAPLIVVLTEPEPGLANSLMGHGHFVLQVYDDRSMSHGEVRKLARPSREGIASALTDAGIAQPRAEGLARDSARNLAVLRRLIPTAPGRLPTWAQEPPHELLAALLIGGWDETYAADKAKVCELSGKPYDETAAKLIGYYVGEFDSPLRKVGSTWRMASPFDAWMLLAHHLTAADLERFEAVAHTVLEAKDPRYDMNPDDRWMSSVQGVVPECSELLRHGISEVLILLALRGKEIRTVPDAYRCADRIVSKLLRDADEQRWWSLARDFTLLAEAAPRVFLDAIEDSLDQNDPPIRVLFDEDKGGIGGTEYLSDLLWALESLAWSPDLLLRVTLVLARLDAIDDPSKQHSNCPANSLGKIHRLWLPQTNATLDQRLPALDLIRKRESDAAWKLMLGLLPRDRGIAYPSATPRWPDFTVDTLKAVPWSLITRGATAISERLLADVGLDAARWRALLEQLADIVPDCEQALAALETAEPKIRDQDERTSLWEGLRRLLYSHRQFPDAKWSLPVEQLNRLEAIYDRFAPTDPLARVAWLFKPGAGLPNPSHDGWEAEERQREDAKRQAAQSVFAEHGQQGILMLAEATTAAGDIGKALFEAGLSKTDLNAVLEATLRSPDSPKHDLAHGLISAVFRERNQPWASALIAKVATESWGDKALLTILGALPKERWTWDQVAKAGEAVEHIYWGNTPLLWIGEDPADITYAIRKLITVGRARHAVGLVGLGRQSRLPSELLVELLEEAARQPTDSDSDANEPMIFAHNVCQILTELDARPDVDKDTLARLEWTYLALLEHSDRPAKVLLELLSEQPSLFVEVLRAVFKSNDESSTDAPAPEDSEHARDIALQAYRLLELWDKIPGSRKDGTIDGLALQGWIKEAHLLAKDAGREDIADEQIGTMLSASPTGTDGNWPAEAVRDAIDMFHSKPMIEGFQIGRVNRRGVTTRNPRDGGTLERKEAAAHRKWATEVMLAHPRTARALEYLADHYEEDARYHDEQAERLDWHL